MKKQTKFQGVIQHAVLSLDRIVPSKTNPRKHFNDADIAELAESIKANGQQMAIIVRLENEHTEARYEIIDGERRYRACLALQMTDILADVREMDDAQVAEYQLMTFLHRKDITPLEEAQAYIDLSKKGIDPAEIAARVGKPAKSGKKHKAGKGKKPYNLSYFDEAVESERARLQEQSGHYERLMTAYTGENNDFVDIVEKKLASVTEKIGLLEAIRRAG